MKTLDNPGGRSLGRIGGDVATFGRNHGKIGGTVIPIGGKPTTLGNSTPPGASAIRFAHLGTSDARAGLLAWQGSRKLGEAVEARLGFPRPSESHD